MSTLPEPDPLKPDDSGAPEEAHSPNSPPMENLPMERWHSLSMPAQPSYTPGEMPAPPSPIVEPLLFQSWAQPPLRTPARIPNFGHLCLLFLLGVIGLVCTVAVVLLAMHFHLYGWERTVKSATDIHLILASEAILYLFTFGLSLLVFPLFWKESFFAGIQWRGTVALNRYRPLAGTALICLGLAALDGILMPGPSNAPIETMLREPGAAWLMFGFGITIAPFFEEMFFRGFLLPALCTAWDWAIEKIHRKPAPPLDANGHPQWSISAMVVASILTSLPFALLHVAQQGHSLGPFLLLIVVSLILCAVRLKTRSLASSTLVHACYNFMIFSLALIGTGGFRHLDKM
jgi:hypothetical protein